MPFAQGKFINSQDRWRWQFRLLIQGPSFLVELFLDPRLQTAMHKTRADPHFFCYVGQGALACLLGNLVAKSLGRPLIPATGAIGFCERSPTRRTPKSSFVHNQIDLIASKLDISFHPLAAIMDLATLLSTAGANRALFSRSHLHLNAFVCSDTLAHNLAFGQIQRHENPLVWLTLSCSLSIYGMLVWHRLSFVRFRLEVPLL